MYETKQTGWIQQAEGVCAGARRSTHRRGGRKIRVRDAPHLDRARNRVRSARRGAARDFMAVKRGRVLRICLEGRNRREVALSPPVAYLFGCFRGGSQCARPDRHEFTLMPVHIIFQCNAHHVPKSVGRKSIMRVFIDPFKKRLA